MPTPDLGETRRGTKLNPAGRKETRRKTEEKPPNSPTTIITQKKNSTTGRNHLDLRRFGGNRNQTGLTITDHDLLTGCTSHYHPTGEAAKNEGGGRKQGVERGRGGRGGGGGGGGGLLPLPLTETLAAGSFREPIDALK